MTTTYPSELTASYDSIKLGIDAHAQYYWINRQVDGATPQPVQKMNYDELMLFVVKQQKLTGNVLTCYEAGAFGFHLHRRLEELGIKNYVVQPQDWDERGKWVKNDRLDAAALCQRLDRYERGNKKAFSPMSTPTVDKESTESVRPRVSRGKGKE
jgi:transposase